MGDADFPSIASELALLWGVVRFLWFVILVVILLFCFLVTVLVEVWLVLLPLVFVLVFLWCPARRRVHLDLIGDDVHVVVEEAYQGEEPVVLLR